jgi:aspartate racemase
MKDLIYFIFRIFMRPKTIGIIGGAGPLAGALLLERILSLSISLYGCYRDADFPKVVLISFPFSEMLSADADEAQLRTEIKQCLEQLRAQGASVIAIGCNTLHAFLDEDRDAQDLVHLPRELGAVMELSIEPLMEPLVLCTSTSVRLGLHKQFFRCSYPDSSTQAEVDALIDLVLKGGEKESIVAKLGELLRNQTAQVIVLGCTELSLFSKDLQTGGKLIIDPLDIMARKVLEKSFRRFI